MRMLVTGGAGFIGSHVAQWLVDRGHTVVVVDDLSGGFLENVPNGAEFREGSITDAWFVNRLFDFCKFDYVYHLAAYAAEGLSHFIKRFNYDNNLIGSVNLINASVNYGVKKFVFTSSIAVYGEGQSPFSEMTTPVPEDSYGISKLAVEQELRASHKMFGLEYVIFRPHNVYGEGQNIGDRYRNVVGIFMNQLLQGKAMTIFGDGTQQRAFTHISDVAPIIAESVHMDAATNQVFNIGADVPYTVKELAEHVAEALGKEAYTVRYLPPRKEALVAFSDHGKVSRLLSTPPNMSLSKGLEKMAKWVLTVGPRTSKKFSNIEISKNMPPSWLE